MLFAATTAFSPELKSDANPPTGDQANASNRQLIYPTVEGEKKTLGLAEMTQRFGLQQVSVYDIVYKKVKTFEGISLRELLEFAGINLGEPLTFVATDGYQIAFDSSLLLQKDLQAIVAFRDLEPSEGQNWELFQHGRDLVNFDPFYLVWAIDDDHLTSPDSARLSTLPWPYQMNEIRIADKGQYALAAPDKAMGKEVQTGFKLYVEHCIKCHQVKGLGGALAPAIDREHSLASVLDADLLTNMVWKIKDYIPQTKMPDFRETFSRSEAEYLVAYLKYVQP